MRTGVFVTLVALAALLVGLVLPVPHRPEVPATSQIPTLTVRG